MNALIAESVLLVCCAVGGIWAHHYKPMLRAWAAIYGIELLKRNGLITANHESWLRERGYR